MSEVEFYQTRMGRTFYEGDVPKIARALERIAGALEAISTKLDKEEDELTTNHQTKEIKNDDKSKTGASGKGI
jgi:hypothetical protein